MRIININEIEGFKLGHAQDREAMTGCSVILAPDGAAAGCDVRGGSPATRETDLLSPEKAVDKIFAVCLSGGSAFGLDAASGVMGFLEAQGKGFDTPAGVVPIVCAASLFDLALGDGSVRPDAAMGYEAAKNAFLGKPFMQGSVGAGTGASVGKLYGMDRASKSGIGYFACREGDLAVGAIVAVNALGDVYDEDGEQIAGLLSKDLDEFISTEDEIINNWNVRHDAFKGNTTIGCILTNAKLSKAECGKIATLGHNGLARAIRPVHTAFDGDTLFCMASGRVEADPLAVGVLAERMVAKAIKNAVINA